MTELDNNLQNDIAQAEIDNQSTPMSVKAVASTNIELRGIGFEIDSYVVEEGDLILAKGQDKVGDNGLYIASEDDWQRVEMPELPEDTSSDIIPNPKNNPVDKAFAELFDEAIQNAMYYENLIATAKSNLKKKFYQRKLNNVQREFRYMVQSYDEVLRGRKERKAKEAVEIQIVADEPQPKTYN